MDDSELALIKYMIAPIQTRITIQLRYLWFFMYAYHHLPLQPKLSDWTRLSTYSNSGLSERKPMEKDNQRLFDCTFREGRL